MDLRYRKTVIAGNWKMNLDPADAKDFIQELRPLAAQAKWCDVVLCVPFLHIPAAVKAAKGSRIAIGAQNCHFEESGPYTGEISCPMLARAGVKDVIIGHSERRRDFGTGYTATAQQAGQVNACIREVLRQNYGARTARGVSILYGGSMNTQNARELLSQSDVDGGLIGGASLKTESFSQLILAAQPEEVSK